MKRRREIVHTVLRLLTAAALCVGLAEFFVCGFVDPPLFDKLTAPAVSFCRRIQAVTRSQLLRLADGASAYASAYAEALRLLDRSRESQSATRPAVSQEASLADPAVTELRTEGGRELLTGGNVPVVYYNQSDEAWAQELFGRDPIGEYGCGPTALAMAVTSLTGNAVNPAEMAAWAAGEGYAAPGDGSYLSIVPGTAEHFGLTCTSLDPSDPEAVYDALASGGMVVALMGPGHFTSGGHFILLHGVTLSGELLAADPNSRENSLTAWDPQLISEELSASRSSGSPLWYLTLPEGL